jgi:hypothetical protein
MFLCHVSHFTSLRQLSCPHSSAVKHLKSSLVINRTAEFNVHAFPFLNIHLNQCLFSVSLSNEIINQLTVWLNYWLANYGTVRCSGNALNLYLGGNRFKPRFVELAAGLWQYRNIGHDYPLSDHCLLIICDTVPVLFDATLALAAKAAMCDSVRNNPLPLRFSLPHPDPQTN